MKNIFHKIGSFMASVTKPLIFVPPFVKKFADKLVKKYPSLGRIFLLTSLQVANNRKFKHFDDTNKKKAILLVVQIILFVAIIFISRLLVFLFENYIIIATPAGDVVNFHLNFLQIVFAIYILFTIFEMSISLVNFLYKAKDNAILMALPVNPGEIFISKLVVKYIKEIKKTIFFVIPFIIGFFIAKHTSLNLSFTFVLNVIPVFIFLPIVLVLTSGLISVFFSFVDSLFKKYGMVKLISYTVLLVGAFVGLIILVNSLPEGLSVYSLWYSIVKSIGEFNNSIVSFLPLSLGIKTLLVSYQWWHYLIALGGFVALVVVLLLLNRFVSYRFFFTLSTKASEGESGKIRVTKSKQRKNIFFSFFIKELKTYLRSDDGFLFSFLFIVSLPFVIYILNRIFMLMEISEYGKTLIICFNLLISLVVITSSNTSCANALSKEGSEFYLLKITPVQSFKICYAKLLLNGILLFFAVLASSFALKLTSLYSFSDVVLSDADIIFIGFITLAVGIGHLFWSLEFDLMNPKIRQYALGDKDSSNITKSLIAGIVVSLLFTLVSFLFLFVFIDSTHFIVGPHEYTTLYRWPSVLVFAIIFMVSRIYLFNKKMAAYFDDLTE